VPESDFFVVTEEEPDPRPSWHPPKLEKAEVNHDTANSGGSFVDGGADGASVG